MSPAAVALDRRLHELRSLRDTVVATFLQLEADATYGILAASGRLSGVTAVRAQPALAQLAALRSGLVQVDQLLDHVSSVRDTNQLTYEQAVDLVALLNSPAIKVPAGSGVVHETTPQVLLDAVTTTVETVRAVVAEVDAAWGELLPRLGQVTGQAEKLAAEMPGFPALDEARSVLATLTDHIATDPLGSAGELDRVEATLVEVVGARAEMARLRDELTQAAPLLDELEAVVREGDDALQRCRAEIAAPAGLLDPVDPAVVDGERGLRPWLERLQRLVADGDLARAARGFASWRDLADQTLSAARQVVEANAGPVRRRQELQGLLRAAQVKAGAAGRAEDPTLTALATEARQALAVPCDLPAAERAVDSFLDELRRPPTPAHQTATPPALSAGDAGPRAPGSQLGPLARTPDGAVPPATNGVDPPAAGSPAGAAAPPPATDGVAPPVPGGRAVPGAGRTVPPPSDIALQAGSDPAALSAGGAVTPPPGPPAPRVEAGAALPADGASPIGPGVAPPSGGEGSSPGDGGALPAPELASRRNGLRRGRLSA